MDHHVPAAPRRFIGPTRGLGFSRGNGLGSNLENVGGRILIHAEMANHKERMRRIKPIISIAPPWSHGGGAGAGSPYNTAVVRPGSASAHGRGGDAATASGGNGLFGAAGRAPSAGPASRPASASASRHLGGSAAAAIRGNRGHSTGGDAPAALLGASSASAEFDLGRLRADEQDTYRDMLRLLCAVPSQDARSILEQLYKEAEDRKLLAAYTGVFPTLEQDMQR